MTLLDEISLHLAALNGTEIVVHETIPLIDILWLPVPDLEEMSKDPAVKASLNNRWVILHRIKGSIRYFMAPEDLQSEPSEWGTVADAHAGTALLTEFLEGMPIDKLTVQRTVMRRAPSAPKGKGPSRKRVPKP